MYEKAEEDAIEIQLQERATLFAQELVKVSVFYIHSSFKNAYDQQFKTFL